MNTFRPLIGIANAHIQTILGSRLNGPGFHRPSRLHAIPLGHGEALAGHETVPPAWRAGDPVAVIAHGMGGSPRSGFVARQARDLDGLGLRVVRLDLRGSGAGVSWSRQVYHAGVSGDIHHVMHWAARRLPGSPVLLVGFSLGGNVVLKYAGEVARLPEAERGPLAEVVALNPPIDVAACGALLDAKRNRFYNRHFVRDLVRLVRRHARHHPGTKLPKFPKRMTVRQLDETFTAPRAGYRDADEYYAHASSAGVIPEIAVPTLIMTARDDPFIAVEPFERLIGRVPAHVTIDIQARGGHLGYLGRDDAGGVRWGDRHVLRWLSRPGGLLDRWRLGRR